jgi:hypothetical protein
VTREATRATSAARSDPLRARSRAPATTDHHPDRISPSATVTARYDVFLSHNSSDAAVVEEIAMWLRDDAGLRPFLDMRD